MLQNYSIILIVKAIILATFPLAGHAQEHRIVIATAAGEHVTLDRLEDLDDDSLQDFKFAWWWSTDHPPSRFDSLAKLASSISEKPPIHARRLTVKMAAGGCRLPVEETAPKKPKFDTEFQVVAAPVQMWKELPEPLLPHKTFTAKALKIPYSPKTEWRFRLKGRECGTFWQEEAPQSRTATLRPLVAEPLTLQLIDETGEPAPGVDLWVHGAELQRMNRNRQYGLARFLSDDEGKITIPSIPDSPLTLELTSRQWIPVVLEGRSTGMTKIVRLQRGMILTGRWIDSEDEPIPGVRVAGRFLLSPRQPLPRLRQASSGEDGRWELSGIPLGQLALHGQKEGYAPFQRTIEIKKSLENEFDFGDLRLSVGKEIHLRVTEVDDVPVSGVRVTAKAGGSMTFTDQDGMATLRDLGRDQGIHLALSMEGFLSTRVVVPPEVDSVFEIRMSRSFQVRGRFLGPQQTPLPSAMVEVSYADGRTRDETIEPSGEFMLSLEPEQRFDLRFVSASSQELKVPVDPGIAGETLDLGDLVPPLGQAVTGRLVNDQGQGIPGARLWTPAPSAESELRAWMHSDLRETQSDSEGSFTLRGLASRGGLLRIEASGYSRLYLPIPPSPDIETGSLQDLGDILLEQGTRVDVVVDTDVALGSMAELDLRGQGLAMDKIQASVIERKAQLHDVPTGTFQVSVVSDRRVVCETQVEVLASGDTLEAFCAARPVSVQGRVLFGDEPAGAGSLIWEKPSQSRFSGSMKHTTFDGLKSTTVFGVDSRPVFMEVTEAGWFTSDELRLGKWEVGFSADDGMRVGPVGVAFSDSTPQPLMIRFPAFSIGGRVVDEEGEPVSRAKVWVVEGGAFANSDDNGHFRLSGLGLGTWSIRAQRNQRTSESIRVTTEPDRPTEDIELVLETGERSVYVQLVTPEEAPIANAFLFFQPDDGRNVVYLASSDSRGESSFRIYKPYPDRFRLAVYAEGNWFFGTWQDLVAEPVIAEFAPLRSASTLMLKGEGLSGQVPSEAALRILTPEGWNLTNLLRRLGYLYSSGSSIPITGLPAGSYHVENNGHRDLYEVGEGKSIEIELTKQF